MEEKTIYIIYDGDCNFCKQWMQFVNKRNSSGKYKLLTQYDHEVNELSHEFQLGDTISKTIVVIHKSKVYFASQAIIVILKHMNLPYQLVAKFLTFIPKKLADSIYFFVAKNRKFFSSTTCTLASPQHLNKKQYDTTH